MYGNLPRFHALVPPRPQQPSRQLVVQARQALWALWLETIDMSGYHQMTRDHLVDGWWANQNGWFPVDTDPCGSCGHYPPRCSVCGGAGRYFLEDVPWEVMLCDRCGSALEDEDRWEVGLFACCDGCGCDTWV